MSNKEQFLLGLGFEKESFGDGSAEWYILRIKTSIGIVSIVADNLWESERLFLDLEFDEHTVETIKEYNYSEQQVLLLREEVLKLAELKF